MAYERADQERSQQGEQEVSHGEQRGALFNLLRTLDFAQGQAALEPGDDGQGKGQGAPPATPALPEGTLARLTKLVPVAISQVDAEESGTEAEAAPDAKGDDQEEKDVAEAAEATAAMEEAENEADDEEVEEEAEVDAQAPAHAPATAKAAPRGRRAPKHKVGKPKASGKKRRVQRKATSDAPAEEAQGPLLSYPRAKAAFKWTKKRNFAKKPFFMRRFSMALPMAITSTVTFAFVQAVAEFQKKHGLKVTGRLVGRTARALNFILRRKHGLDKKKLLTAREVKLARANARKQLKAGTLKRKTIKELRTLLGLPPGKGELGPGFLRKLAEFQAKHGLTPSAYISKRTIKKLRETARPGPGAPNSVKLAYAKKHAVKIGLVITSTTGGKHAPGSYHYSARAIDVAGSAGRMSRFYKDMVPLRPTELFYDPEGGIKHGQSIGAIGDHMDHVHVAF